MIPPRKDIQIGDIHLVYGAGDIKGTVTRADRPVNLTPTQFAILAHLMSHPGITVKPLDMYQAVWVGVFGKLSKPDDVIDNYVKVQICKIRAALMEAGEPNVIGSSYREGYYFSKDGSAIFMKNRHDMPVASLAHTPK